MSHPPELPRPSVYCRERSAQVRVTSHGHTLCLMKAALGIVAVLSFIVAGLLLVWGGWLLATDDPDGGRHPAGAVMLVVAVLSGLLSLVSFRWLRRH